MTRKKSNLSLVPRPSIQEPSRRGPTIGTLVELDEGGRVLIRLGAGSTPTPAMLATSFSDRVLLAAVRVQSQVLVDFLDGDRSRPVILGLLRAHVAVDDGDLGREAGDHVAIEAQRSITIGCGESQIELRADGTITTRGNHVVVSSSGATVVEGATVRIN